MNDDGNLINERFRYKDSSFEHKVSDTLKK